MTGFLLEPGDELEYLPCVDDDCPAHREGYWHAHGRIVAAATTAAKRPAEGGTSKDPDLRL